MNYVPFHVHSSYSDGFSTVEKNVLQAVQMGLPGLGIMDHGTCAGLIEHHQMCIEHGIKPILGTELYIRLPDAWVEIGQSRNSRSGRFHMSIITTSFEGYKRLIAINNAAHQNIEESRGKKYPIATLEMIEEYAGDGLVALTGCVASVTFHDYLAIAEEYVNFLIKSFGKNNVYAEVMPHVITQYDGNSLNGFDRPIDLAKKFGLKTIYSTDAHAATEQELPLLASYTQAMKGYEFTASSIKSKADDFAEAVKVIGKENAEKAFQGNAELFDRVEDVNFRRNFTLPQADEEVEKLKEFLLSAFEENKKTFEGALCHNGQLLTVEEMNTRFKQEWDLLDKYSFWSYFAILWDILKVGHEQRALTVARGSASGSYILYLLGITQLHPIVHGLMFERFLAELRLEKNELPDVDVDISEHDREVIQNYAKERWNFMPVGTTLTYSHSSAVRVIGRIYEKMLGREMSKSLIDSASDLGEESEEFKKFIHLESWMLPMYNGLLGSISGYGAHACAVAPLDETMPVPIEGWGKGLVINYSESGSNKTLQTLGIIKYDLLSSENLALIKTMSKIAGVNPPKEIADDDPCFAVFNNQDLTGLFQFDTRVGRNLIKLMIDNGHKIRSIRDLSDLTSLGRPGPLHEQYHITYAERSANLEHHADVIKSVFQQTNGVIIYQEQVAELFARVSFKEYDKYAKEYGIVALKGLVPKNQKVAATEKFQKQYQQLHDMFVDGGEKYHGLDVMYLEEVFAALVGFVRYGFNLSHSLSYANISAQEAWFKHYYPSVFWSTILEGTSNSANDRGKLLRYVVDATVKGGLTFKAPHINTASHSYALGDDNSIQCPISMVKGLGAVGVNEILANQPFESLEDINTRTKLDKSIKLAMYQAGMMEGLKGDLYDLGVCDIKEFKNTGNEWDTVGFVTNVQSIGDTSIVTINGEKYIISSEHSDEIKKYAKDNKFKVCKKATHLKEGTEILFHAYKGVIIGFKRTRFWEPLPVPVSPVVAMKNALGFAIPPTLRDNIAFSEQHDDKVVGYVVEIEERNTDKTTQIRYTLQNGKRVWACIEDRTDNGWIMSKSKIKSKDDCKIIEGDFVGFTLVMTKNKDGNITTYNQIKSYMVIA